MSVGGAVAVPEDGAAWSTSWGRVRRTGGVAAFLLLAYSVATMVQLAILGGSPATAAEAFRVLQQHPVEGLLRLDLPTMLVPFWKAAGIVGVVAHGFDLAHVALSPLTPTAAFVAMGVAGPLYLLWFPLVGARLLRRTGTPDGRIGLG